LLKNSTKKKFSLKVSFNNSHKLINLFLKLQTSPLRKKLKKNASVLSTNKHESKPLEEAKASESFKSLLKSKSLSEKSLASDSNQKTVDICFVIDATGSMKPWIDQIKTKVSTIIQNVLSKYPGFDIRVSVVAYRDFDQGSHSFEIKPFSRDLKDIESFLHTIVAKGGDDGPEDVNGALQKVC